MRSEVRLKQSLITARRHVHRPLESDEGDLLVDDLHSQVVDELHVRRIVTTQPVRDRGCLVKADKGKGGDAEHHEQNQPVASGDTNKEWNIWRMESQVHSSSRIWYDVA